MAYSSWSVTFGEVPTAAKWNILGTNDAYFNGLLPALGYTMQNYGNFQAPADATNYYFGSATNVGGTVITAGNTTADIRRVYIPKAGTVKAIYIYFGGEAGGTSETSTINFRKNNTTDTSIVSTIATNTSPAIFSNTSMSVSVSLGDYYEFKWVTPTWATNPTTNILFNFFVYIE